MLENLTGASATPVAEPDISPEQEEQISAMAVATVLDLMRMISAARLLAKSLGQDPDSDEQLAMQMSRAVMPLLGRFAHSMKACLNGETDEESKG